MTKREYERRVRSLIGMCSNDCLDCLNPYDGEIESDMHLLFLLYGTYRGWLP